MARRLPHARRSATPRRRRESDEYEWMSVSQERASTWRPLTEQRVLASFAIWSARPTE